MKRLFITCDQATTICDKSQYNEATFFEKITLMIHFKRCKRCSRYSAQNSLLSQVYKMSAKDHKNKGNFCLSKDDKSMLKETLDQANK